MTRVRYIVEDVDRDVAFYVGKLGFRLVQQFGPAMAILERDGLELWLAGPLASASKPMPDGSRPTPGGGWSRFVLTVSDLPALAARLRTGGVGFRNEITPGPGGRQLLCLDPSGNLIELFEPA